MFYTWNILIGIAKLELAVKLDKELSRKINSGNYSKKIEQIERKRKLFL